MLYLKIMRSYYMHFKMKNMWEGFGSVESDVLSNSRRTGNDVNVEEEVQRVLVDDKISEKGKKQG